jgi:ubiquinone biosynthesis protein
VPENVLTELRKLQDDVPPFDTVQAMQGVAEQLGRPVEACFASIDEARKWVDEWVRLHGR